MERWWEPLKIDAKGQYTTKRAQKSVQQITSQQETVQQKTGQNKNFKASGDPSYIRFKYKKITAQQKNCHRW